MSGGPDWGALPSHRSDLDWRQLESYAEELERWNRAIRLVGPKDLAGIRGQISDALIPFLLYPPAFPLLDIGSGAGLPGIPLAIAYPGQQVVCLEANMKKVSFLRHAVRHLGLAAVRVAAGRAEALVRSDPSLARGFETVTARAVTDVERLLSLCRPFLAATGRVYLPRGEEPAPLMEGWQQVLVKAYEGPVGVGRRQLLVYVPSET